MRIFTLLLGLVACYFPAVAGARGRGSRKLWIGFIFLGLCIAFAAISLGGASSIWTSSPNALSLIHEIIIRAAIGFAFGSFLAALLYKKKRSVEGLNLDSDK